MVLPSTKIENIFRSREKRSSRPAVTGAALAGHVGCATEIASVNYELGPTRTWMLREAAPSADLAMPHRGTEPPLQFDTAAFEEFQETLSENGPDRLNRNTGAQRTDFDRSELPIALGAVAPEKNFGNKFKGILDKMNRSAFACFSG